MNDDMQWLVELIVTKLYNKGYLVFSSFFEIDRRAECWLVAMARSRALANKPAFS
jgi:hypothetical protein